MTRNDKTRSCISSRRIRRERVIPGHVCMSDFDFVFSYEDGQMMRTFCIKCVAKRKYRDIRFRQFGELFDQLGIWAKRSVNIVASMSESIYQIGKMSLTAAEGLS